MNKPIASNLPANLPEDWKINDAVSPSGTDVGLTSQHGYNYFNKQVNDAQKAINTINEAFTNVQEAIKTLVGENTLAAADLVAFFDASANTNRSVTLDVLRRYLESFIAKAYTTAGTGTAYTITNAEIPTPRVGSLIVIIPHVASATTLPTLSINGGTALQIRRKNSVGDYVDGGTNAWLAKDTAVLLMCTGSYWLALDRSKPSAADLTGVVPIASGGTGASNLAGAKTALGITALQAAMRGKNFLHNWDFSSPYIPDTNQRIGTGEFLGRWYSATAGNQLTVHPNSGLAYLTTSANGYFSQIVTRELANFFSRAVTFSVYFAVIPAAATVQIAIYSFDTAGAATTVATASATGSTLAEGVLKCTGNLPATYDKLECRILLGTANQTVTIQKAKLEVGSESTLAKTDVADVAEQALLCRVTNASGQYIGGASVIASASVG